MILSSVNLLAVLGAAIFSMALGFIWYSDILFGKIWRKASGLKFSSKDVSMASMQKTLVLGSISTLITAYILAVFLSILSVVRLDVAWQVSFWFWLGFVAPIMYLEVLYGQKSHIYYAINTGYQLVSILAMATILTWWI